MTASPFKQGYQFIYTPGVGPVIRTFTLTANPQSHGVTGGRHYLTDQTMRMYYTDANRDATTGDPTLP